MEKEEFITPDNQGNNENLFLINRMQIELAERKGMSLDIWIEKYSQAFREFFHKEIVRDSHFLKHDKQTHEATLDVFERELYKNEKTAGERLVDEYQEAA